MPSDHRRIFFLATKSTARFHLHHSHAIFWQVAEFHQGFVYIVGALQRTPRSKTLLWVERGNHSVIFYVELFLSASPIFTFNNIIGTFPYGINIALFDQIAFESVVSTPYDLGELLTLFHAENCGQRIVFD